MCLVKVLHDDDWLHDVMSLLLLTGPLWWLPLSQLHVVGVEGEREKVEGERGTRRRESYKYIGGGRGVVEGQRGGEVNNVETNEMMNVLK